uniref:Uncharacterized protein n=1 Tax=Rhizophora mucronata TaxID=61149 RepID=A0A2P2NQZ7_RHIMU
MSISKAKISIKSQEECSQNNAEITSLFSDPT